MSFRATTSLLNRVPRDPVMGRATRGLYHGKHIMFGNTRAHSERKTRRSWKPNVQPKNFTSAILNQKIHVNVTTKALKCIDKAGGFDNYIMNTKKVYFGGEDSFGSRLQDVMRSVNAVNYYRDIAAQMKIYEEKRKAADAAAAEPEVEKVEA